MIWQSPEPNLDLVARPPREDAAAMIEAPIEAGRAELWNERAAPTR